MTFGAKLKPELENFLRVISGKTMYSGATMPESIMKLIEIEIRQDGAGILAPYWLPVLQKGRGPRVNSKDHQLWRKIYKWMEKNSMFRSSDPDARISEAKGVTWYINKHGNKHFRSKAFVDMYESARKQLIKDVEKRYIVELDKIAMEIL